MATSEPQTAFKCSKIVLPNEVISGAVVVNTQGIICKIVTTEEQWKTLPKTLKIVEVSLKIYCYLK